MTLRRDITGILWEEWSRGSSAQQHCSQIPSLALDHICEPFHSGTGFYRKHAIPIHFSKWLIFPSVDYPIHQWLTTMAYNHLLIQWGDPPRSPSNEEIPRNSGCSFQNVQEHPKIFPRLFSKEAIKIPLS